MLECGARDLDVMLALSMLRLKPAKVALVSPLGGLDFYNTLTFDRGILQQGPEWAWHPLEQTTASHIDGALVPVTMFVGSTHSLLIYIPDVTPSGALGLVIRLMGSVAVPACALKVVSAWAGRQPRGEGRAGQHRALSCRPVQRAPGRGAHPGAALRAAGAGDPLGRAERATFAGRCTRAA